MHLNSVKIIDLTQPLFPDIPTWTGSCGFCLEVKKDYDLIFKVHQIKMHAGAGTHIDAPSHRFQGALDISEIPLEQLFVAACVIDVSSKASKNYEISSEDIQHFEKAHGRIPSGNLVIGYTGWSRFWTDPKTYRGIDAEGRMHFPAFSAQAAELLLERNIAGIAIDTLSPDCLDDSFPVHRLILGANKYIIENVGDCSQMPPKGASVIALPLKAKEATESPIRMIGIISY